MPFFSCGAAAERGGGSLRECGLRFARGSVRPLNAD